MTTNSTTNGKATMRHQWEFSGGNRNYATLHTDRVFPKGRFEHGEVQTSYSFDPPLSDDVKGLLERIAAVPGVDTASLRCLGRYQASFTKGSVFDWATITPVLLEIVLAYFGASESEDAGEILTTYSDRGDD